MAAFAVQSSRCLPERYARDPFDQHVSVSRLIRDAAELRHRGQEYATVMSAVAQRQGHSHGCCRSRPRDTANTGFVARREFIVQSDAVNLMGRLYVDLFLQDNFLLYKVDVKIRLVPSKDAFPPMAGGANPDYKIHIVNAILYAKKVTLSPDVQMTHIKTLDKSSLWGRRHGDGNSQENTSWGECTEESGRGDGRYTHISKAKWKGY